MTFLDLAKQRYSERYFDSKPVEHQSVFDTVNQLRSKA